MCSALLFCDREIFEDSDEMNQKSGRVSKKLGRFSKTDVGFWRGSSGSSNPAGQRHRNWLQESNKKDSEFMSEHGPLARRVFESTSKK
jgi:hypothetical protein